MGVYARKKNDRKEECMETIIFDGEDGTELELGILEQTRVNGRRISAGSGSRRFGR